MLFVAIIAVVVDVDVVFFYYFVQMYTCCSSSSLNSDKQRERFLPITSARIGVTGYFVCPGYFV